MTKKLSAALLAFLLIGCSSQPINPTFHEFQASAELNMGPHEALQAVEQAVATAPINLPIEKEDKGAITTGWREYPGDWHIIRQWQERTRFHITVAPDFDQPDKRSKITIDSETQQRAASQQEWQSSTELNRPERARELLSQIMKKVK